MVILYMSFDQKNSIIDKKLISFLSKERQEALLASKNTNHNSSSIYAELLLRYGLDKFFQINGDLSLCKHKDGKPFLPDYPNIDFNISHTENMVMCGITNNGNIGVDVEHNRKIHKNVEKKVYNEKEIQYVNEIPEQAEERFFEIWTKKEAYTKYLGTGLRNNITDINMLSDIHKNKLTYWNEKSFYFSIYSDDTYSSPIKITTEELCSYFL